MRPDEFRAVLARLGIGPAAFAAAVGTHAERVGARWASGAQPIPAIVATIARLAVAHADRMPWAEMARLLRDEADRLDREARP